MTPFSANESARISIITWVIILKRHSVAFMSLICQGDAQNGWNHKKRFKFPWKFCLSRHAWINQWFHNKSCLLWWPASLSIRIQTRLNHIRFVLYHNIEDNERNLRFKICWQLKTPTPTWKCTRSIMQMSYFPCKNFRKLTHSTCRSNTKTLFKKRVKTTKPHFALFLPGMNVEENVFFFRARVQKGIAWHIDASSVVWTLILLW